MQCTLTKPIPVRARMAWSVVDDGGKQSTDRTLLLMQSDFRTLRKIKAELDKRPEVESVLAGLTTKEVYCFMHYVLLIDAEQKKEDEMLFSRDIDARVGERVRLRRKENRLRTQLTEKQALLDKIKKS